MQFIIQHFFAPEGKYKPSGLFTSAHFILLAITLLLISKALYLSLALPYNQIRKIIRWIAIILWILETIKIIFKVKFENSKLDYDTWIPLYYCSLGLYASVISGFGTGVLQRMGDVFLGVGSLVGGVCFLMYPSSSILIYPWYHFLVLHSFFYHGCLTYMGILVNRSGLLTLNWSDFILYAVFFLLFCTLAVFINKKRNSNLMFIERPFKGTILDYIYDFFKDKYKLFIILVHLVLPFVSIMIIINSFSILVRPDWYPPI